jgi:hypothetical protein
LPHEALAAGAVNAYGRKKGRGAGHQVQTTLICCLYRLDSRAFPNPPMCEPAKFLACFPQGSCSLQDRRTALPLTQAADSSNRSSHADMHLITNANARTWNTSNVCFVLTLFSSNFDLVDIPFVFKNIWRGRIGNNRRVFLIWVLGDAACHPLPTIHRVIGTNRSVMRAEGVVYTRLSLQLNNPVQRLVAALR